MWAIFAPINHYNAIQIRIRPTLSTCVAHAAKQNVSTYYL